MRLPDDGERPVDEVAFRPSARGNGLAPPHARLGGGSARPATRTVRVRAGAADRLREHRPSARRLTMAETGVSTLRAPACPRRSSRGTRDWMARSSDGLSGSGVQRSELSPRRQRFASFIGQRCRTTRRVPALYARTPRCGAEAGAGAATGIRVDIPENFARDQDGSSEGELQIRTPAGASDESPSAACRADATRLWAACMSISRSGPRVSSSNGQHDGQTAIVTGRSRRHRQGHRQGAATRS